MQGNLIRGPKAKERCQHSPGATTVDTVLHWLPTSHTIRAGFTKQGPNRGSQYLLAACGGHGNAGCSGCLPSSGDGH